MTRDTFHNGWYSAGEHIQGFINCLDSGEMTVCDVRSAIWHETLTMRPKENTMINYVRFDNDRAYWASDYCLIEEFDKNGPYCEIPWVRITEDDKLFEAPMHSVRWIERSGP